MTSGPKLTCAPRDWLHCDAGAKKPKAEAIPFAEAGEADANDAEVLFWATWPVRQPPQYGGPQLC